MAEFMINLIECLLFYWLVVSSLKVDRSTLWRILGLLAMTIVLTFFNQLALDTTVQILSIWGIRIGYVLSMFQGKRIEQMIWPSAFMIVAFISERIALRLTSLMGLEDLKVVLMPGQERYMAVFIYLLFIALLILGLKRVRYVYIELPFQYQILFLGFVSCSLICADSLSDHMLETNDLNLPSVHYFSDVIFLMLTGIVIIFFIILYKTSKIYMEKNQLLRERQNEELLKHELEMNRQTQEMLSGWRHDYQNHMNIIQALLSQGEVEKARNYLDKMDQSNQMEVQSIHCGNPVLDAILSSKIAKAKMCKIPFEHEVLLTDLIPLEEYELTALLGNLLDNAIEANMQVEPPKRLLQFQMKSIQDHLYVMVKNRFDSELVVNGNELVSSKKEEGHGIGLRQVKKILHRVGGFMDWEVQKDFFIVKIVIPIRNEG